MKIEGKVAVVVGGARGIGRAYCRALMAKGAKIVMGDILDDLGERTISELCEQFGAGLAVFTRCDNTKDEDVKALFQKAVSTFGTPDIVVNSAGILHEFEWERCLNVNLVSKAAAGNQNGEAILQPVLLVGQDEGHGTIRCCNEALKYMSKANGGHGGAVVNTASVAGLGPAFAIPMYAASKHACVGYTTSWGQPENVAVTGVRFNCVCPTLVDTEFHTQMTADRMYHAQEIQEAFGTILMLTPESVAEALIRLIEDDSLTGQALRVTQTLGQVFAEFVDWKVQ